MRECIYLPSTEAANEGLSFLRFLAKPQIKFNHQPVQPVEITHLLGIALMEPDWVYFSLKLKCILRSLNLYQKNSIMHVYEKLLLDTKRYS